MSEDGQRGPGSSGTAHRGRPGAGQARQDAGGESPPGDGQDHAGTPRPDALIPALDEDQLAALREIGREWDRVSADPHVWRQALPADPSLGEHPEASKVRPALFTRFVPVAGADGQLPPIQATSVSETPPTPLGRAGQALKRLVFGPPLDATAIAVERMRKLVALPVLSADAPGRTAVILARQPSPRASPMTLVMCPGTGRPLAGLSRRRGARPPGVLSWAATLPPARRPRRGHRRHRAPPPLPGRWPRPRSPARRPRRPRPSRHLSRPPSHRARRVCVRCARAAPASWPNCRP